MPGGLEVREALADEVVEGRLVVGEQVGGDDGRLGLPERLARAARVAAAGERRRRCQLRRRRTTRANVRETHAARYATAVPSAGESFPAEMAWTAMDHPRDLARRARGDAKGPGPCTIPCEVSRPT